jgi:hypothetical protein
MLLLFHVFSLVIDFTWCFFWGYRWRHLKYDIEGGLHSFVLFLSWVGILLKFVVIGFIILTEWNNIKSSLPTQLRERLHGKNYAAQEDEL